jgi:hypothetical protein
MGGDHPHDPAQSRFRTACLCLGFFWFGHLAAADAAEDRLKAERARAERLTDLLELSIVLAGAPQADHPNPITETRR